MVHNALCKLSSTWGIREPVRERIACCFAQDFWSQVKRGLAYHHVAARWERHRCLLVFDLFVLLFLFFSYTCSLTLALSLVLLGSCSLARTLLLLLFMLLFSSPPFSLLFFFETLLFSYSWIVCHAFFRSLLLFHEFSFVYRRVSGRYILELGAIFQSSSLLGQPVVQGATFLH